MKADIVFPSDEPFDKTYKAQCACGWKRDFGYMRITCERETELHAQKCDPPCSMIDEIIIVSDATPLKPPNQRRKLKRSNEQKNTTRTASPI